MNENVHHHGEPADPDAGSEFAAARKLFQQFRDVGQERLTELTSALTKLVESHYSLLQASQSRSDVINFLVGGTMRSAGIKISGGIPGDLRQYVKLLKGYLLIKCRLEGLKAVNGSILLQANPRARNPGTTVHDRLLPPQPVLRTAQLIVMAEMGIIYVDTGFANIRQGLKPNDQGIQLPIEILIRHAESNPEWRIDMPLPAMGSKEDVAFRFAKKLLTGEGGPHLLSQFN